MRDLNGVIHINAINEDPNEISAALKVHALLFDKLHIVALADRLRGPFNKKREEWAWISAGRPVEWPAELDFLREQHVISSLAPIRSCLVNLDDLRIVMDLPALIDDDKVGRLQGGPLRNFVVRQASTDLLKEQLDSIPILEQKGATVFSEVFSSDDTRFTKSDVLRIGLSALPVPGEESAWEDIINFRVDSRDKLWAFRRFLDGLATRRKAESEIRDEIEWSLNEYSKAMAIHKLKSSQSFVDVLVITPLEIIENVVKFNWSKIAKGALQVTKRSVELMEAEMKAPGRECAYVVDARKRFGGESN